MTKKPVGDLSYRMHNAIDMLVDAGQPWPARVLEEAESALVTLDAENDRLLAEVERLRSALGPCVCNTGPDTDGPSEDCPEHGRGHAWWVGATDAHASRANAAEAERDAALARMTKAEATLVEVAVLGGPMYTLLNEMGKDD